MTEPYLSVILPVYKCGKCIEPLYQRLVTALEQEGVDFEIIFVDDRGDDAEWRAIEAVAAPDHRVRAFRHRLNYGQPAAIATGLARSKGRYALVMDADLQDPPEIIGRFLAQAQEGSDIVLSVKTVRRDSLLRRLSDACISRLFPIYTRFPNGLDYGCFVLLSRPVVERLLAEPDRNLQFTKLLDRLDGLVSFVYYEPARRFDGPSSYSFLKLVRHTCVLMGPEFWSSRLKASTVAALVFLVIATCIHVKYWESVTSLEILACTLSICGVTAFWGAIFCQYARFVSRRPLHEGPIEVAERIDRGAQVLVGIENT